MPKKVCVSAMGGVPKPCCFDCKTKDCNSFGECFDRFQCILESNEGCVWLVCANTTIPEYL